MATKVYKSGYQVIVDEELKPYNKYTTAKYCSFGFDGDICWIKELADTEEYIYNDNVDQMLDKNGARIGDKVAVEGYLIGIIGDPTNTPSVSSDNNFIDTFNGTVIDTGKWTVNDSSGNVAITQDEEATLAQVTEVSVAYADNIITKAFPLGAEDRYLSFDILLNGPNTYFYIGVAKAGSISGDNIQMSRNGGDTSLRFKMFAGGVEQFNTANSWGYLDKTVMQTYRMAFLTTDVISFQYWNGSTWVVIIEQSISYEGDWSIFVSRQASSISVGIDVDVDNVYLTDTNFITQYPV